jgi:hypothetical protein
MLAPLREGIVSKRCVLESNDNGAVLLKLNLAPGWIRPEEAQNGFSKTVHEIE